MKQEKEEGPAMGFPLGSYQPKVTGSGENIADLHLKRITRKQINLGQKYEKK